MRVLLVLFILISIGYLKEISEAHFYAKTLHVKIVFV